MMKKILFLLFFFSILTLSYSYVEKNKEVSTSLYCKYDTCSNYNIINTKLYFEDRFGVSTTAQVLSPAGADPNDLPDGAVICPGQITLHSSIKSYFAQDRSWSAKMSVAVGDDLPSDYEDYTTVNRQEFEYSENKYEEWYARGNAVGQNNPFSNTPEPVTFSPTSGVEYENKKGFAGGVVKAKNIFSAAGTNEQYFEGEGVEWTTNLGEGSYDVSSQLNIEGVTIGLTRTGDDLRTAFYSFTDRSDNQNPFSTSLPEAKIHIDVVNLNDIQMDLVSRTPEDPIPVPTDMKITVKNTGSIPIKINSASITSGYSIQKVSGFGQEIQPGEEHLLTVHIKATQQPPPTSATITLTYQSSGPTCDGTVKTETLDFAISIGIKKSDLSPKIGWSLPVPFYEGDNAEITVQDCNQFSEAGPHSSHYSIKTNDGNNVIKEETVQVGGLDAGKCQQLYTGSVACTKNIIVSMCSDVNNQVEESNEDNNCITETKSCSETGEADNCTLTPSYATFIPPSSKYFKLSCSVSSCASADWRFEDLDEHVSGSGTNTGILVSVDAEAPPQKGEVIANARDSLGKKYTCSSVIDVIESECEDFI